MSILDLWHSHRNGDEDSTFISCGRCGNKTRIAKHDDFLGSATICYDCEKTLRNNPSQAAFELRSALARSDRDMVEMRARWARQDAARAARAEAAGRANISPVG